MGDRGLKLHRVYRSISIILAVLLIFVFTTAETTATQASTDEKVINEVREALKLYYVDDLPDSILNKPTINEILAEINKTDPYTKYYSSSKYQEYVSSINNESSLIGFNIELVPEGVKVVSLRYGTPENEAGVLAGDIILMADNHILVGLNKDAALGYIKGKEGTTVKLKIQRGNETLSINVVQRKVSASLVGGQILDKHIGYIKIDSFGENSGDQFGDVVNDFEKKKVDSYIVDLRYNNGGFRDEALDIAGYFIGNNVGLITKGKLIGTNKSKNYFGKFHGMIINKPVIFLINEYTASASEVLVGAVKDYGKAYFIGTKTYGKGSTQWPARLINNDILKLTLERNYTPKGHVIDMVGIEPDLNMSDKLDTINVAELILDSPNFVVDDRGYIKIDLGNKTVYVSLKKAQTPSFWQAYRHLLNAGANVKGGSVMIGTSEGWKPAPKNYLLNLKMMYYPPYKDGGETKNIKPEATFNIGFKTDMNMSSFNDNNIQLLEAQTGERVPVDFITNQSRLVTISPKGDLTRGKTYFIVISPKILKKNNQPLGLGTVSKIVMVK